MPVALTGGTGFVGGAIAKRLLDDGFQVKALSRKQFPFQHKNLEIVHGEMTDNESLVNLCRGSSVVLHCAGMTKSLDYDHMMQVNGHATRRLAKIAQQQRVKRFLYLSSLAARAPEVSIYAQSKREGEHVFTDIKADQELSETDMLWDIVRPPAIYGPGDEQFLSFFKMIRSRLALIAGKKDARVSFVYIDDLVDAIHEWVLSKRATGQVYEISGANDQGYKWSEVMDIAASLMQRRILKVPVPKPLLVLIAGISQLGGKVAKKPALLNLDKIGELRHDNWQADSTLFETNFDWAPKTDIEKGFEQTLNWYYQQARL